MNKNTPDKTPKEIIMSTTLRPSQKHTQYAYHVRMMELAKEGIENNQRFFPKLEKYGFYDLLQEKVSDEDCLFYKLIDDLNGREKLEPKDQKKLNDMQAAMKQSVAQYNEGIDNYPLHKAKIQELEQSNDQFLAPEQSAGERENKRDKYLHLLDEETCLAVCKYKMKLAEGASCQVTFKDKSIELTGNQTDAVRIWYSNSSVSHLSITDTRHYGKEAAHRDAIQLIPPKQVDKSRKVNYIKNGKPEEQDWILADQMAGSALNHVNVEKCTIYAPNGFLQGVFSTDGFYANLTIKNNKVLTKGAHSININGFMSGEITGNILTQVSDTEPAIRLYPGRIGGNQAEEGMAYILSFAQETPPNPEHDPVMEYSKSYVHKDNQLLDKNGNFKKNIEPEDLRHKMPEDYRWTSIAIKNFKYYAFREEYSTLTLGDYKTNYSHEYSKLKQWLEDRIQEYTTGKRLIRGVNANNEEIGILGDIDLGDERREITLPTLKQAQQNAVFSSQYDHISLSNLPETPIRVFTMKQIAIRPEFGELQPLLKVQHHENEAKRQAVLKYLLTDEQLNDIRDNPNLEQNTGQTTSTTQAQQTPPRPVVNTSEEFAASNPKIIADKTVAQGDDLVLTLDTDYKNVSYFWLFGNYNSDDKQISNTDTLTIKTDKLDIKQGHRVRLSITDKKTRQQKHLSLLFEVTPKQTTTSSSTSVQPSKPYILTDKQTCKQGEKQICTIDSQGLNIIHYYWICGSIRKGGVDTFEIDTNALKLGKQQVRASLTIKGEAKPVITDYADFNVIENTSEQIPSQPKIIKTNEEFEASQPKIIANSDTVEKGNDITLRLDTQYENISYYWLFVNPANNEKQISQKETFTIKTNDLAIGKSPRVRAMLTNRQRKQVAPKPYYFTVTEKAKGAANTNSEHLISTCAIDEFTTFAKNQSLSDFKTWSRDIFGGDIPDSAYEMLYSDLKQEKILPLTIEVKKGTFAAYDNIRHKVIVGSQQLDAALTGKPDPVWTLFHLLLEENGHHFDYLLRNKYSSVGGDAYQDEGASFAFYLADNIFKHQKELTFAKYKGRNLKVGATHKLINTLADRNTSIGEDQISYDNRYEYSIEITDTATLKRAIKEARNGSKIIVPKGNYDEIVVRKKSDINGNIVNKINLQGKKGEEPTIKRINISGMNVIVLKNLKIGTLGLPNNQIEKLSISNHAASNGVKITLTNEESKITIKNLEITGVADALVIEGQRSSETPNQFINISYCKIHNIRRDAIILRNVGRYGITHNEIHSIHPNYEPYMYAKLTKDEDNIVILPTGERSDHADGIQIANGKGGTISNNTLTIGTGEWYQAINIHTEGVSPYANGGSMPLNIKKNTIKNNHDFAIQYDHPSRLNYNLESANTIIIEPTPKRPKKSPMGVRIL